ncbi:MAG: Rhodanese-like protein [Deltaproteobacteria bacterium]|jgi:rhodanese-related sulfurtransferase|nr:Rhodanese-like protein [Deltaproteobacteria bacterium]
MIETKKIIWLLCLGAAFFAFLYRPGKVRAEGEHRNLSPVQARELIEKSTGNPDFVLLDVRTPGEFRSERIGGAVMIDYNSGTFRAEMAGLDRGKTYIVYCRTGNRSDGALKVMKEEGFRNVYHLDGGIVKWKEAGLPTQK